MAKFNQIVVVALGLFVSSSVFAAKEVMFEGYYKILTGGKPSGYSIQRYAYDSKKKQFYSNYFIHVSTPTGALTESMSAVANNQFHPISYQYTSQVQKKLSTIDAKFKVNNKTIDMTYTVADGQNKRTLAKTLSRDVFLSTFLPYLVLQKGMKPGVKFTFDAISEEDAVARKGELLIKKEPGFEEKGIHRILMRFKGVQLVANINEKGEVIIVDSPVQQLRQHLVATPAEATKGFDFNTQAIQYVFGNIPTGRVNSMAQNKEATAAKPVQPQNAVPTEPLNPQPQQQSVKVNPPSGAASTQKKQKGK